MVKHLFLLLAFLPTFLLAGNFTAAVNRNQIPRGESLTLDLILKEASAKGDPDITPLDREFVIHSKQQSSNTVIMNGRMSSSKSWKLTLIPNKEGDLTIPSISIETTEGVLSTKPIAIHVGRNADSTNAGYQESDISLATFITNPFPYKNEPFTYTVKLIAKKEVANVQIRDFSIDGAIVEQIEKPSVEEQFNEGIRSIIITFSYLITPMNSGNLTIPQVVIQGGIPEKRKRSIDSFFDMDFGMMNGFQQLKPFALTSEEMSVEVQPPVPSVTPWLPARSLKIEDNLDHMQKIEEGEPITFNVTIKAEGVRAAQLPNLSELIDKAAAYNIYTDQPGLEESVSNGIIKSARTEQFTLIPQKDGAITLPALSISWWDTNTKEKKLATISARTLTVLPAPAKVQESIPATSSIETKNTQAQSVDYQKDPFFYLLVTVLVLLFGTLFWVMTLQRKIARLTETPRVSPHSNKQTSFSTTLKNLQSATSPSDIRDFLQWWGHQHWNLPKNANISLICEEAKTWIPVEMHAEITVLEKTLEDALYKGQDIKIKDTADRFALILDQAKSEQTTEKKNESLPNLNPT